MNRKYLSACDYVSDCVSSPFGLRDHRGGTKSREGDGPLPTASLSASHSALIGCPAGEVQLDLPCARRQLFSACTLQLWAAERQHLAVVYQGDCIDQWKGNSVGLHKASLWFVTLTTYVDVCNMYLVACSGRLSQEVPVMRRYVTYMRVSTTKQGRSGLGLDAQERDINLFLENYSDVPYEIVCGFVDIESGTDDDRPELKKAVELAKREEAELLVSKLDRLSRRVSFIAALMDDKKLKLRVAAMPHADKFQLHIYAALAEQERDFISLRTKAALTAAKARGKKLGGLRDKTMKRNDAVKANAQRRAEKVAGIVVPLREAGKSLRDIAAELDRAGVETARGGKWSAAQVNRVLSRIAS